MSSISSFINLEAYNGQRDSAPTVVGVVGVGEVAVIKGTPGLAAATRGRSPITKSCSSISLCSSI